MKGDLLPLLADMDPNTFSSAPCPSTGLQSTTPLYHTHTHPPPHFGAPEHAVAGGLDLLHEGLQLDAALQRTQAWRGGKGGGKAARGDIGVQMKPKDGGGGGL